ncbi:MAG: hypothetical protein U0794_04190 [Isosphaeraceae bacterium]
MDQLQLEPHRGLDCERVVESIEARHGRMRRTTPEDQAGQSVDQVEYSRRVLRTAGRRILGT